MDTIQVREEKEVIINDIGHEQKFRYFIQYKDFFIYENTQIEVSDIKDDKIIPYNIGIEDVFIDKLYTHVLYLPNMKRDLYEQKIINSTKFEMISESPKTFTSYIDFETIIKEIKIESGKMALYLVEPNIIKFKILEINREENIKLPNEYMYLLRLIECKPIDVVIGAKK